MKRLIIMLITMCLLAGCTTNKYTYDENFDPNRASQVLVGKYKDFYVLNMTDGIFICSEDFSVAEQLVDEYCFNPYVSGDNMYYYGDDETSSYVGDGRIECVDITTGNSKWIYSGDNIGYFAPLADGWLVSDEHRLLKLREDGLRLYEYDIPDMGYAMYSNEKFFIYVTVPDTKSVKILDFETKKITELFTVPDGNIRESIICDGVNIYYSVLNGDQKYDFCIYNMNNKENETLIKDAFGEEFVVYNNICYYYHYDKEGKMYLKAFDIDTKMVSILKELDCDIYDLNILDNKLFYRKTYYGKQLEMFDLETNSTVYLYEKYLDATKRVP